MAAPHCDKKLRIASSPSRMAHVSGQSHKLDRPQPTGNAVGDSMERPWTDCMYRVGGSNDAAPPHMYVLGKGCYMDGCRRWTGGYDVSLRCRATVASLRVTVWTGLSLS
jgi:hypothetical protein